MARKLVRCLVAAWLVGAGAIVSAVPAGAEFTENKIGCSGSATITDGAKTYRVSADQKEAKVPRKGTAEWQGAIATTTHNHKGEVRLSVAFWDITVGSWGPSPNAANEKSRSGTKKIPSALEQLPAGKYKLSGFHQGDEGRCAGKITVEVEGSILNIPGIVSLAGTVLTGAGLAVAGKAKN